MRIDELKPACSGVERVLLPEFSAGEKKARTGCVWMVRRFIVSC